MSLSPGSSPSDILEALVAQVVRTLRRGPLMVAQNGEAEAVIQDIEGYEQMQETVALLKVLSLG